MAWALPVKSILPVKLGVKLTPEIVGSPLTGSRNDTLIVAKSLIYFPQSSGITRLAEDNNGNYLEINFGYATITSPTGVKDGNAFLPATTFLQQNYPNPFNPVTTIPFKLQKEAHVKIEVFNVAGEKVATLVDRTQMPGGEHKVQFDASRLPSGVYIYSLTVDGTSADSKKMVLLK
ncbi:TPA: T9SS type A sorting domain-containing protein [Candidatus Micrarchaeota archaeon]|nr:T9SS type A sorting domain-containing protein [Candidatus Micrarchaeota archaeon]